MLRPVLAIVPVKGREGKNRLDGLLQADERARLVEAMLADVLAACGDARSVERTLVVTPEPGLAPEGTEVLVDAGDGHAAALVQALADERAGDGALVVMADCALVTPDALDRLAAAADPVALAPAQDGGVNALALREPVAFRPAWGIRDAAARTVDRAREAGVTVTVVDDPALGFDVDRPVDVWRLRLDDAPDTRARRVLEAILPPTGGLV
jgi:2-phospho-L-lactate guanylyltransferase